MNNEQDNNNQNDIGVDKSNTSSDISPKGSILPKVYNGFKKSGNLIKNLVSAPGNGKIFSVKGFIVMKFKLVLFAILFVLAIIIIILIMNHGTMKGVNTAISSGVDSAIKSWPENLTDEQKDIKDSYEKTGSLLDFDISDIKKIDDKFAEEFNNMNKKSSLYRTYKLLESNYGSIFSIFGDGAVSLSDRRTLYMHMLLISKYDFNNVKWKEFSHTLNGEDSKMVVDRKKGMKYPDDSDVNSNGQTEYSVFSSLLKPYLLTYEIPMASFCAFVDDKTFNDDTSLNYTYALIKNCLSEVVVNRYDVKKYVLDTMYDDYDYELWQSTFEVDFYPNGDGTYNVGYSGIGERKTDLTGHYNTAWNDNNEYDIMRETVTGANTNIECKYYVSEAQTFDTKFKYSYTYIPYSDSDAQSRIGENSQSKSTAGIEPGRVMPKDNGMLQGINSAYGFTDNISALEQTLCSANNATSAVYPANENGVIHAVFTCNSTYQKVTNGTTTYINRVWEDYLTQGSKTEELYKYSDLIEYNENLSENPIKGDDIKSDTKSNDYYELYEIREQLNRLDFMNANPSIYNTYLTVQPYSKYVGIHRQYMTLVYKDITDNLKDVQDKNDGKFPYVYGKTLGLNTSSSSSSQSYTTGLSLLKEYIRSWEGVGEQPVKQNGDGVDCYVAYLDEGGNLTVGYGINLTGNPSYKKRLEEQTNFTISEGSLVPVEWVDAIEDEFILYYYNSAKTAANGIEMKEYQYHALASMAYNNVPIASISSMYNDPEYWDEEKNDRYDEVKTKYKDNPENVSAIQNEADLSIGLYANYMSKYVHSGGKVQGGLVNRRKSEFIVFSLGYYDKLKRFYSGGGANMAGFELLNGDQINYDAVLQTQEWYENELFANGPSAEVGINKGGSIYKTKNNVSTYQRDHLDSIAEPYRQFFAVTGNNKSPDYKGVIPVNEHFQCTWWAESMGYYFLYTSSGGQITETFGKGVNLGNGGQVADSISSVYHVPTYSVDQLEVGKHYILSIPRLGHVIYVEAVGKDEIVVSQCGSGKSWYGVAAASRNSNEVKGIYVCMEDILATYGF